MVACSRSRMTESRAASAAISCSQSFAGLPNPRSTVQVACRIAYHVHVHPSIHLSRDTDGILFLTLKSAPMPLGP